MPSSIVESGGQGSAGPSTAAYVIIAAAAVALVAATTGFRDEVAGADAWEHHRAVRVIAALGPRAGNPTYATAEPSVRYSPYTLALAWVVRTTGWDSWDVLSGAAVVNTALIAVALFCLLCAYGARRAAAATLVVALVLYGASPAYANTLAIDDLPWHMVNPSALTLAVCLSAWAAWRWAAPQGGRVLVASPLVALALAVSLLVHGMTGALGGVGLLAVALAERGRTRVRLVVATAAVGLVAAGLCVAWPYYSFAGAMLHTPDPGYWFNETVVRLMLTSWCLPCALTALLALPLRQEPVVRFGLWGLAIVGALTAFAIVTRSATFARLPLAGLIFAQVLTGRVISGWRLSRPGTWRDLLRGLRSQEQGIFVPALVRVIVPALIALFAAPKLTALVREPHLLRPRLARFTARDLQTHRHDRYAAVLGAVGERDVVMADPETAWPIPSFHGRVVGAAHFEFFTPGQQQRFDDAERFTTPGTPTAERRNLLERYGARWILLDRARNAGVLPELLAPAAVVREEGSLVLMDARRWLEIEGPPPVTPASLPGPPAQ